MNDGGLRLRVKKGAKKDDILIRFPLKTSGKYISPALQLTKNMEMKYFCVSWSAKVSYILLGSGFSALKMGLLAARRTPMFKS